MAEEIDDNGFYREDFSAESDWEIFNAQLCELFQKWELANNDWQRTFEKDELYKCDWKVQVELLHVQGKQVSIAYYKAQLKSVQEASTTATTKTMAPMHEDLLSVSNTFEPPVLEDKSKDLHWLARFYGLRRFVVLNPRSDQGGFITKRSEFSFYLSSIYVVAAEVCSSVPIFAQIYDQKWNFFLGLGMTSYMRTNFDLVGLEKPPKEYCYLSGIMNMFKEKIPNHCKHTALVSVRNTYALDTVKIRVPMYVPFGMTPIVDEERSIISVSHFTALPHGFFPDSRTELFAIFTWPELTDSMVIDSASQTQLVPSKAPCGSIYQAVYATSYLSSCLKFYHNLKTSNQMLESYVGQNFSGTTSLSEVAHPLDQLTKPNFVKFNAQRPGKKFNEDSQQLPPQKKLSGPMNEHELNQMLYYLFPDMHPDVALFPYETRDNKMIDPHRIKSAVADSLVHRLSCLLATCNAHFGGKSGLAQLWATFTRELRLLWDCCITIPGVAAGYPDTRTCLLHQKLQMLNVCMERRLEREQGIKVKAVSRDTKDTITDDEDEEEDDNDTEEEFYDCDEVEAKYSSSPEKGLITNKPAGRLKRLANLKLLDSEEYLYVPITQDAIPKTEDELQIEADVMLKLGSSSDHVTAMMCSTLYSDTEAFKAANLNSKFEDFIRWYSPNDWEEYTDEEGKTVHKLSARMMAEGNTWKLVWEQAKAVPITRQKRLFDDTNEGFKILNYLETRKISDIYGLTVVPLLHSSVLKLKNIFKNCHVLELFADSLDEILADLSRFSRDIEIVAGSSSSTTSTEANYILELPNPKPITKKIEDLEKHFYQYKCFERMPAIADMQMTDIQAKFQEMLKNHGICDITTKHLNVDGEATSLEDRLLASFQNDMSEKLINKDYVIRMGESLTNTPDVDAAESVKPIMPQFLRATVTGEKLRLCGAFTENTSFLE